MQRWKSLSILALGGALLTGCASGPATLAPSPATSQPREHLDADDIIRTSAKRPTTRPAAPVARAAPKPAAPKPVAKVEPPPKPNPEIWTGQGKCDGIASFYAGKFIGRRTANGERYTGKQLTAAHRVLPFGTKVHVYNVKNGLDCIVRINDRGPFIPGRIIDLSPAAAKKLDMLQAGITHVRLEVVD